MSDAAEPLDAGPCSAAPRSWLRLADPTSSAGFVRCGSVMGSLQAGGGDRAAGGRGSTHQSLLQTFANKTPDEPFRDPG